MSLFIGLLFIVVSICFVNIKPKALAIRQQVELNKRKKEPTVCRLFLTSYFYDVLQNTRTNRRYNRQNR